MIQLSLDGSARVEPLEIAIDLAAIIVINRRQVFHPRYSVEHITPSFPSARLIIPATILLNPRIFYDFPATVKHVSLGANRTRSLGVISFVSVFSRHKSRARGFDQIPRALVSRGPSVQRGVFVFLLAGRSAAREAGR